MAKDFLNVIERALMMGISDKINSLTETGEDIHVFGEFPETGDLKFPAIIVEQTGSGFEEQFMGQKASLGSSSGTGEIYGITYTIHLICDKESNIQVTSGASSASDVYYKQRRLLNWLMLNVANTVADLDWDTYEEEDTQIIERHLQGWTNIGFIPELQWYGASAVFMLTFTNFRT
mgnify:CR=1 FL=1|jgi:hypothetical protein|tara:strand:- start:2324 stop:2851 length:528 start_codon:yes stop_codon:yes gene_type:complete